MTINIAGTIQNVSASDELTVEIVEMNKSLVVPTIATAAVNGVSVNYDIPDAEYSGAPDQLTMRARITGPGGEEIALYLLDVNQSAPGGPTITATSVTSDSITVNVAWPAGAPCRVYYRVKGSTTWTARVPSEDSSNFSTHNQTITGLAADTEYEFYAEDHINNAYITAVAETATSAGSGGGGGSTITAESITSDSFIVSIVWPTPAPCRVYYRVKGSTTWTARVPSEDSSNFSTHNQTITGLTADTEYEFYAEDHINSAYTTAVAEATTSASGGGGGSVDPQGFTLLTPGDFVAGHSQSTNQFSSDWSGNNGFVADGGNTDAWRVSVAQGAHNGGNDIHYFSGTPTEVICKYRVFLPPAIAAVWKGNDSNMKMPGLTGNVSAANGGYGGSASSNRSKPNRAWSARQQLHRPGTPYTPYAMGMELYWPGSPTNFGDTEWYSSTGSVSTAKALRLGIWEEIAVHVKVNDHNVPNGFIKCYINGVLEYQKLNVEWSEAADMLHVKRFWLDAFHGGAAKSSTGTMYLFYRDIGVKILA